MGIRSERSARQEAILEGRFVEMSLQKTANQMQQATDSVIARSSLSSPFWFNRSYNVQGNEIVYTHPMVMRFADMRTVKTKKGESKRKKNHEVHNKPNYGVMNNLIRELTVGFTDSIRLDLMKLNHQEI